MKMPSPTTNSMHFNISSNSDHNASSMSHNQAHVVSVLANKVENDSIIQEVISYTDTKVIGNGSFGVVFQAKLCSDGEIVAIKKVLQDRRFKNRELNIMKELEHCNIVKMKYYFMSTGENSDVFLNLVLEFVPDTIHRVARYNARTRQSFNPISVKLYMYQVFRALAYIHSKNICHRDIKPQNLLLDTFTGHLKLCDFGSAKQLVVGEPNVSYICSRYYRAPELIFGAVDYSCSIDIWSSGCVLVELLLGTPLFPGESGIDQLVEIIKILGSPSKEQILEMNSNYKEFKFPLIKPQPWHKLFKNRNNAVEAVHLISKVLEYSPSNRLTAVQALTDSFFDQLRQPNATLPNNQPLPPDLFHFTYQELKKHENLLPMLIPEHKRNSDNFPILLNSNNNNCSSNNNNRNDILLSSLSPSFNATRHINNTSPDDNISQDTPTSSTKCPGVGPPPIQVDSE